MYIFHTEEVFGLFLSNLGGALKDFTIRQNRLVQKSYKFTWANYACVVHMASPQSSTPCRCSYPPSAPTVPEGHVTWRHKAMYVHSNFLVIAMSVVIVFMFVFNRQNGLYSHDAAQFGMITILDFKYMHIWPVHHELRFRLMRHFLWVLDWNGHAQCHHNVVTLGIQKQINLYF